MVLVELARLGVMLLVMPLVEVAVAAAVQLLVA
jgi:hypothetical protein